MSADSDSACLVCDAAVFVFCEESSESESSKVFDRLNDAPGDVLRFEFGKEVNSTIHVNSNYVSPTALIKGISWKKQMICHINVVPTATWWRKHKLQDGIMTQTHCLGK